MTMSVVTLLTEEEFLALPQSAGKQELINGELIDLPPATDSHDELARRIEELLRTVLHGSRIWKESAYRLPSNPQRQWLKPDVSVSWPDQPVVDDYKQNAPMLAIEIASRGNTPAELELKRLVYLQYGAAEMWVIYPDTRTMLVARPGASLHIGPGEDYRCEVVPVTVTPEYRTPVRPRPSRRKQMPR
jgi:Uma2 family endonuclease